MKIYIAGPWAHRADMPEIAAAFEQAGHSITWKWWTTPDIPESDHTALDLAEQARNDYKGVHRADVLILVNSAKSEGKAVEQGIALAEIKPIIAIGKRGETSKNVFHYLENYFWVETVEDAIKLLPDVSLGDWWKWMFGYGKKEENLLVC